MARPALRDRYVEMLMRQIDQCRYPSHQMMGRAEQAIGDQGHARDYVGLLIDKLGQDRYPSPMLLDRVSNLIDALER